MTSPLRGWLAGAMALAAVGTAEAMPVAYDEAVDGDISGASFIFDAGGNTNQGSGSVLDFNSFAFTLQLGQELLSVLLAIYDVTNIDYPALIFHPVIGDATHKPSRLVIAHFLQIL